MSCEHLVRTHGLSSDLDILSLILYGCSLPLCLGGASSRDPAVSVSGFFLPSFPSPRPTSLRPTTLPPRTYLHQHRQHHDQHQLPFPLTPFSICPHSKTFNTHLPHSIERPSFYEHHRLSRSSSGLLLEDTSLPATFSTLQISRTPINKPNPVFELDRVSISSYTCRLVCNLSSVFLARQTRYSVGGFSGSYYDSLSQQ